MKMIMGQIDTAGSRLAALQKAVEGWIKTLPASNRMAKEMEEALRASRTESK